MRPLDLVGSAIGNTFRSKTRLVLTILSIFVGAFTLALTSGFGTGINAYIADTVGAVGSTDTMTVSRTDTSAAGLPSADAVPQEYDPGAVADTQSGRPGATVSALTPADLTALGSIDGVTGVQATRAVSAEYVETAGSDRYVVAVSGLVDGQTVQLVAGRQPDDSATAAQVVLPTSYVSSLGFADDQAAVGQTVSIAVADPSRTQHVVPATVVGIADSSIVSATGPSATANSAFVDELWAAQNTGIATDQAERYASATVTFAAGGSSADVDALKARLADAGYTGRTVADQLGTVQTVIDGIVLVLDAFAVIALLAAAFGIVNTLYMSVQERTREIGLMKAMGMGSGRVFALFSVEAVFIGLLGSALGVLAAIGIGTGLSAALSGSVLSGLPGLTLIAFDPVSVVTLVLVVMAVAFVAGTLPAARAARADPVTSLRYE